MSRLWIFPRLYAGVYLKGSRVWALDEIRIIGLKKSNMTTFQISVINTAFIIVLAELSERSQHDHHFFYFIVFNWICVMIFTINSQEGNFLKWNWILTEEEKDKEVRISENRLVNQWRRTENSQKQSIGL